MLEQNWEEKVEDSAASFKLMKDRLSSHGPLRRFNSTVLEEVLDVEVSASYPVCWAQVWWEK